MLLALIIWLAPHLSVADATLYAREIADASACYKVDPLAVLAVIKRESQFRANARSRTRDYGLMQLHVDQHTHRRYLGREKLLFEPARNIWLGVRLMAWWRRYHNRRCHLEHHWLGHYGYGMRVPPGWRPVKFRRIYRRLIARRRRQST